MTLTISDTIRSAGDKNKNNNRFQKPFFLCFLGAIIVALLIMQISYTIYEARLSLGVCHVTSRELVGNDCAE